MKFIIRFFIFVLLTSINVAFADVALLQQENAKKFIEQMVTKHHFDRNELIKILKIASFQQKVIDLMEKPYERKPWDIYRTTFLNADRLNKGIEFWQKNQKTLEEAQEKFKVPAHIIVAILGVETLYGERQGDYRVLDALTTLAFYYPKRAEFFTKELKEFLLLSREQNLEVTEYKGSYAGAIGKPQFMPSSYRHYAVSLDGKGKIDLINKPEDAIVSVANYFKKHGWKLEEDVAFPVQIEGDRYKKINTKTRKATYDFSELAKAGIKPVQSISNNNSKVGLIELATLLNSEYWLTYPNFYVITRYNSNPQYALVVYLLSQELKNSWLAANRKNVSAYV